jgi:hypothetical protein
MGLRLSRSTGGCVPTRVTTGWRGLLKFCDGFRTEVLTPEPPLLCTLPHGDPAGELERAPSLRSKVPVGGNR